MKKTTTIGQILFLTLIFTNCQNEKPLFELLSPQQTGVGFVNKITENDTLNILNTEYVYNGGGVGIGDFNGDGLQDLFFTANQGDNKLYLNRGEMRFEDVTAQAQLNKTPEQWSSGINILDINGDGKLDIYVSNTFHHNPEKRRNVLLINGGNTEGGIPQYRDMAKEYGVDDTTHSSNAQFFDYDHDGDLDLFIAVNFMNTQYPNQYFPKVTDGSHVNTDRLLRNDWDAQSNQPKFTDVSKAANIKLEGYSHSTLILDFNNDGWLDIYVANDYSSNDLVYINQKNGTFKNEVAQIFKHQANSAMGSDVADINNDGRLDMFTTEMLPYHNKRKKLFLSANNYTSYINNETFGYEYQYTRNVLQLNQGINPETQLSVFSDVAFLSDVQETEWSWTPLMADFDNDGNRDIFITNGFPRDVTDHDFGAFRGSVSNLMSSMTLQAQIPQIKVPKFMFKNKGDLAFEDVSQKWGLDKIAFSNGGAYGDLDNDGDLDLVVNNINDPAFIFKNTLNDKSKNKETNRFLRLDLRHETLNTPILGATVTAFFNGQKQSAQTISARGYISASENTVHFGLGAVQKADSVLVFFNGKRFIFNNLQANQTHILKINPNAVAEIPPSVSAPIFAEKIFNLLDTKTLGLDFLHKEEDVIDFNAQKTLPHKFSQFGPSLSVGDVNGDGLDDFYIGGSSKNAGTLFFQQKNGSFQQKITALKKDAEKKEEETGTLFFDADGDADLDMYLVHGSYEFKENDPLLQDALWVNDGKGNFSPANLPAETANGQVVRAADFDGDGDLDLFIGGNVLPRSYPKPDRSFLLRNDTKEANKPIFTDVTTTICPELAHFGIINDALWTDFDNDNKPDLLLAGEWQPLTFFKNNGEKLVNATAQTGIGDKIGWWTSLAAADFDNDGDTDYIGGNYGKNIYFKCSSGEPLSIYAKDFDNNGLYDPFISCFWRDTAGQRQEFFYHTRDDMIKQLVLIRRKFDTYAAFGTTPAPKVFTPDELKGAQILKANCLESVFLENKGGGQFSLTPLPVAAQLAPLRGMMPYDVDADGLLDLILVGNDFGMELLQGRADAFNGLILKNLGSHKFDALSLDETGFCVPADARALSFLHRADGQALILATQNRAPLKVFSPKNRIEKVVRPEKGKTYADIILKNGQKRRQEFYYGHSFLSQHPLSISVDASVKGVIFR